MIGEIRPGHAGPTHVADLLQILVHHLNVNRLVRRLDQAFTVFVGALDPLLVHLVHVHILALSADESRLAVLHLTVELLGL